MVRTNVSWRPEGRQRIFGLFVRWDGDTAIVRRGLRVYRVPRGHLTWEVQ